MRPGFDSRRLLLTGALAGLAVRVLLLPLPGTSDVRAWKVWSYGAVTGGVTHVYGVGGTPPERRLLSYGGERATVDYPPLALYELYAVGLVYRALFPEYPNTAALTVAVKGPVVLADLVLAGLLWWWARRVAGSARANETVLTYWLNPAIILNGAVLGYLDPLCGLPAVAALMAAPARPALAGALFAAAVLTKVQALLVAPGIGLALWRGRAREPVRALAGAAATAAAVLLPVVLAGAWRNLGQALHSLTTHDMLSGQAANLWWIATYAIRVWDGVGYLKLGLWEAMTAPVRILPLSTIVDVLRWPDPKPVALLVVAATIGWASWRHRAVRDVYQLAALAAFVVDAYFVLSVQVHENHQYLALPMLAVAAVGRPSYRGLLAVLSALAALNLNLFYGLGEEVGYAIPRGLTVIDLTVVLALANLAVLGWFARRLLGEAAVLPPAAPVG
jgi:hypothetical protein